MEPEVAQFLLKQIKEAGAEVLSWIESKGNDAAAEIPLSGE